MKKHILLVMSIFVLVFSLVGCGNNNQTGQQSANEGQEVKETRVVKDVKGEVEIPMHPERIVDISGASDILSILGYDVIGTANSDGCIGKIGRAHV